MFDRRLMAIVKMSKKNENKHLIYKETVLFLSFILITTVYMTFIYIYGPVNW